MSGTGVYEIVTQQPLVEEYIARLERALSDLPETDRDEAILELRAHIEDAMATLQADDPQSVATILTDLGTPEEYAANLKGAEGPGEGKSHRSRASGTFLGLPYDFSRPTAQKLARRLWNPSDPRILMPKVFGAGWTINMGAVAVKLGLIRPDDEEAQPFSSVPERVLRLATIPPFLLNSIALFITLAYFSRLPSALPIHFNLIGQPDGFSSANGAIGWLFAPSLVLMVALTPVVFSKKRSRMAKALSVAILMFASTMSSAIYLASLYYGLNKAMPFNPGFAVIAGVAILFLTLVSLSKIGLREEWRQTFDGKEQGGKR